MDKRNMLDYNYIGNLARRDSDIADHLLGMYGIALGMNARLIVELGAGQSTYALTAVANRTKGQLFSFDLGEEAILRLFPEGEGVLAKEKRFTPIIMDSIDGAEGREAPIDFLLIDSWHTYEHVREELKAWSGKVRSGGVIAMHDSGYKEDCGVRKAIDEFIAEKKWPVLHLQDTKHLGISYICKP